MLAAPALLVLLTAVGAPSSDLHVSVSAALGYHRSFAASANLCVQPGPACTAVQVSGPGLTLSSQLLYGGFVRGGARVEVGVAPVGTLGVAGALLGVVQVGGQVFGDVAAGVGYAWAQASYEDDVSVTAVTRSAVGFAATVRVGVYVSEALALVARGGLITGEPGSLTAGLGLEWAL